MQIIYENDSVKELFDDLSQVQKSKGLMIRQIGPELTRLVKKRYDQLRAADNFYSFVNTGLGKPHPLSNMDCCYGIHINANWRIVVKVIAKDISQEALKECDTILIKGVVDYHGKGTKNNWIIP